MARWCHAVVAAVVVAQLGLGRTVDAQQARPAAPGPAKVGFLHEGVEAANVATVDALTKGLSDHGFVDGQTARLILRWGQDRPERLAGLASDLVTQQVSVIVTGGPASALAAKSATRTISIVFTAVNDPVRFGLVASLNRPGGNITGSAGLTTDLDAKRLEFLAQVASPSGIIGVLVNRSRPNVNEQIAAIEAAARSVSRKTIVMPVGTADEIEKAIPYLAERRASGILIGADPFLSGRRGQLIQLMARYRLPAIFQWREFADDGGLMSYGPSRTQAYFQSGIYAGRILKGDKPQDLPVEQRTRFDFVINLKTAKLLGIEVPPSLLAFATEVIE